MLVWRLGWRLLQDGLDWLLPPACQLCGETLRDPRSLHLCLSCLERFPPLPSPRCPHCLLPHPTPVGADYPCEGCLRKPLPVRRVIALGSYEDGLREAVHRFKFRDVIGLQRPLGQLLAAQLARESEGLLPELIVPVPLHRSRLRQRGYNQALLLACELRRSLGIRLERRLLQRDKKTCAQQELPLVERQQNVKGAFAVAMPLQGERVLLVDDVLTTGATVRNCAQALLASGAAAVDVAVLARAPRPAPRDLSRTAVHG